MLTDYLQQRLAIKNGTQKSVEKKMPVNIAHESKKRAKLNRQYRKIVSEAITKDGRCKVKSPVCTFYAQGMNHIQKRSPANIIKRDNLEQCCNACNNFIEQNSKWALANGFTISRFKK